MAKASHTKKALLLGDIHAPYHSQKALMLVLRVAREWQPDIVLSIGDLADFYAVSSHDKDPARGSRLKEEAEQADIVVDMLTNLGAKRNIITLGNHESRLDRFIASRAPELHGIVSVEQLLGLKKRGWEQVPYRSHIKIGKLTATHECGSSGARAHLDALRTFGSSVVIGHNHRSAVYYTGTAYGERHMGASLGWLGDVDTIDYMHRVKSLEWQLAMNTALIAPNGNFFFEACPIIDYQVRVDGVLFK